MDDRSTTLLLCAVSRRVIGLPLDHVLETMRPLPIEQMPDAPAFVSGLAIIRGEPVPVVNAGRLLDEATNSPGRFVTVRSGDRAVALAVDGVLGVRTVPAAALHGLPPLLREANATAVAAIGRLDAALLIVLRGARLIPDQTHTLTSHTTLHGSSAAF